MTRFEIVMSKKTLLEGNSLEYIRNIVLIDTVMHHVMIIQMSAIWIHLERKVLSDLSDIEKCTIFINIDKSEIPED